MLSPSAQWEVLKHHVAHLVSQQDLMERLAQGRPLNIKFGVDPTRPDLTFGHLVVFNKLRAFQELGHRTILLIGDYTTLIGDPSGRSSTRPVLTPQEIQTNTKTYLDQAFKVLDKNKTIVRYNSEWFKPMDFGDCLTLARQMTVAQMLERDDFSQRYQNQSPISIVEFLYPLLQGHDSVVLEADVELGGDDQLFNLLVGRDLQKIAGQKEQIVMTLPLLIGLDGAKKMSKSLGNYIAFNDSAQDMFGKIMSISDTLMWDYYRLLLEKTDAQLEPMKVEHPMACKKNLAQALVERFHGAEAAQQAREGFEHVFSHKGIPVDMPVFEWNGLSAGHESCKVADLLYATELFPSKNEVRRLIEQGAIQINDNRLSDINQSIVRPAPAQDYVVQAGKRIFFKIIH